MANTSNDNREAPGAEAVARLLRYADDLDLTERPSPDEYDVTADIRSICTALRAAPVPAPGVTVTEDVSGWTLSELSEALTNAGPGPWALDDSDPDNLKIVCVAYDDETPGVCGDHSPEWKLAPTEARLIVLLRNNAEALIAAGRAALSAALRPKDQTDGCS